VAFKSTKPDDTKNWSKKINGYGKL